MKKILIITTMLSCLFVFGCTKHGGTENEGFFYDNTLTVKGVFQDVENNVMAEEGTLVLDGYFDDHADHIYFPKGMREEYLKSENDYLPGNKIKFMGDLKEIDAGAGNHYYVANKVDELKLYSYPTKEEVDDIMDGYNYCEQDDECISFDPGCPFGCFMPINKVYSDIGIKIVNNYSMQNNLNCTYDCAKLEGVACEDNKCVALTTKPAIPCTEEELATSECNTELDPVCGNDELSYSNKCLACSSNSATSYYLEGCENDSITTYEQPKNGEYIVGILNSQGSVSCEFKYKYKGEDLSGYLAANEKSFFSNIDIYYNSKIQHGYHLLALSDEQRRYDRFDDKNTPGHIYEVFIGSENEIYGTLSYIEVFSDLQVECSGGIPDETVFNVPNDANIIE